jgi:hypothetical protein
LSLWEAGLRERLISKPFKIKDISACSVLFQVYNFIQLIDYIKCLLGHKKKTEIKKVMNFLTGIFFQRILIT